MLIALSGKLEKSVLTTEATSAIDDDRVKRNITNLGNPENAVVIADHSNVETATSCTTDSSQASNPSLQKIEIFSTDPSSGWKWTGYWSFGNVVRTDDESLRFPFEYNHSTSIPTQCDNKSTTAQCDNKSTTEDNGKSSATSKVTTIEVVTFDAKEILKPSEPGIKEAQVGELILDGSSQINQRDHKPCDQSEPQDESETSHSLNVSDLEKICNDISGDWKGSFEALTGLKSGPKMHNISETFSIRASVNPEHGVSYAFDDTVEGKQSLNDGSKHLVYVIGNGENQFGMFELIGTFKFETQILQCQRRYTKTYGSNNSTSSGAESESIARGRKRRSSYSVLGNSSTIGQTNAVVSSQENRLYNTRKRQLSWQRHSFSGDTKKLEPKINATTSTTSNIQEEEKLSGAVPVSPTRRSSTNVLSQLVGSEVAAGTNLGGGGGGGGTRNPQGNKKLARLEPSVSKDSHEGCGDSRNDRKRTMSQDIKMSLMTEMSESSSSWSRKRVRNSTDQVLTSSPTKLKSKGSAATSLLSTVIPAPPLFLNSAGEDSRVAGAILSTQIVAPDSTDLELTSATIDKLDGSKVQAKPSPSIRNQNCTSNVGDIAASDTVTVSSEPPPELPEQYQFTLPSAGVPNKARWRDAHFLYFQKSSNSDASEPTSNGIRNGTNGNSHSNDIHALNLGCDRRKSFDPMDDAKFVVYEGDTFNSQRHGRGICLYSNNGDNTSCTLENMLLYEGDWQYDKEHGVGTLMTWDRKCIIYKGEWERGKIHGKGIYFYRYKNTTSENSNLATSTSSNTMQVDEKIISTSDDAGSVESLSQHGSVATYSGKSSGNEATVGNDNTFEDGTSKSYYEGEFKENMRQGNGKYFFKDGSTYEGMWQNNMMTGRGVFTWPDGSRYEGEWKDGKRNGAGLLRASDGFIYDGMWLNNTMEGKGTAVYPSGQQYNGTFHNGCKDGRGTLTFTNGAVYEGRFRNDAIDGQGTLKITQAIAMPVLNDSQSVSEDKDDEACRDGMSANDDPQTDAETSTESSVHRNDRFDIMIPISFQSDMGHIHRKAGFTVGGE